MIKLLGMFKKIKMVPALLSLIIVLSGLNLYQHNKIASLKKKLIVSDSQVQQNADAVDSLVIGTTETVKQLQASNSSCSQLLKDQQVRTSKANKQAAKNENTIQKLKGKISQIDDVCTNAVIPAWLLSDTD